MHLATLFIIGLDLISPIRISLHLPVSKFLSNSYATELFLTIELHINRSEEYVGHCDGPDFDGPNYFDGPGLNGPPMVTNYNMDSIRSKALAVL